MRNVETQLAEAAALHGRGAIDAAAAAYAQILALEPENADALHLLGVTETQLGRPGEGLALIERSLALNPRQPAALANGGNALMALSQADRALEWYRGSLSLWPEYAPAHFGCGHALLTLDKPEEAVASFDRAIELQPDFLPALIVRGHALKVLGRLDAALESFERALMLRPDLAAALYGKGLSLYDNGRFEEALPCLRRVRQVEPGAVEALGPLLHAQLQVCDWQGYDSIVAEVCALVDRNAPIDFIGSFLPIDDSPERLLSWTRQLVHKYRVTHPPLWNGEIYRHDRIRIAYVSADFLEHPTAYLMAGLFERHDVNRFETLAVSLREDALSPMARRVRAAFEHVEIAGSRSDAEIAQLLRDREVDIVVDLMGYTALHRARIFAHRPAPIQVNYLGYPATLGSPDMDYIIADEFLIPSAYRGGYSERVVRLPECYQANDDRRPRADGPPSRIAAGLPERGFVWAALHSSYKMNPALFDVWARLLRAVPDSVLWLVAGNRPLERNLRREAEARGVDPRRLVFAQRLPYPLHLARLPLADLCLDTLPYNGGATSSDMLWAGVPLITVAGRTYAARMSGSLLHALGLPELITETPAQYERRALDLALDPPRLMELRARLAKRRVASPLFKTERFCRHLEMAYTMMVQRYRSGEPPADLRVAPLAHHPA